MRVVGEVRGQRVAVVVVAHLLVERLGDALGQAAVHLAVGQQRVEDRARRRRRRRGAAAGPRRSRRRPRPPPRGRRRGRWAARRSKSSDRRSAGRRARRRRPRAQPTERAGVPATWKRARGPVEHDVVERWPRAGRPPGAGPRRPARPAAPPRAAPAIWTRAGAAGDPAAGTTSVSPWTTSMRSMRDAGPVADEHRPGGVVALAVGRRAGHDPQRRRRRAARPSRTRPPAPAVIST